MGLGNLFNGKARREQRGKELLAELEKPRGQADLARAFDLVARGAGLEEKNAAGSTPLMLAVLRGYTPLALELIDHGAEVNAQNALGGTALIFAAQLKDNKAAAALLAKGADATAEDSSGFTALAWAQKNNLSDLASRLRQAQAGKDLNEKPRPKNFEPPLK